MFYDIVYSPDDGGYYCVCYDEHAVEHFVTDVYPTKQQAENAVVELYKNPIKVNNID